MPKMRGFHPEEPLLSPKATEHASVKSAILIAELMALREEIQYRSVAQHTLLNLALTGVAAVAAFALNNDALLFLLIPPLCFILGTLVLDHTRCVERIGDYIGHKLRKDACELGGDQSIWRWEILVDEEQRTKLGRLVWSGPFFLLFIGSGIMALLASSPRVFGHNSFVDFAHWWPEAIWSADAILILILTSLWVGITPVLRSLDKHDVSA